MKSGRRPRPRVHGRGRGGRARREEPQDRRSGGRPVPDRLRRVLRCAATSCSRCARTPTRTRGWPRSCGAIRRRGCSATRTCSADSPGGQAEYVRVPFADVGRSRSRRAPRRAGAVPVRHPAHRVHGRRDVRHPARRRRSPSGARDRWDSSPSRARTCSGPSGSSPSTASRTGCGWPAEASGAETLNYEQVDVGEALREMTGGRGPDACIDAVGMEAHGPGPLYTYDRTKQALELETDRPIALRQAILRLSQRRDGVGHRRVRRLHRQVPDGCGREPLAHDPDRPVSRAAVHEAVARADRAGRDRSELRHHAPAAAARGAGGVTTCSSTSRTTA